MARTRSIKPGFFANEYLADLSPLTRLLFIGLWTIADREGRLEDRPRRIKAELLPYDAIDATSIDEMLQRLHEAGFITRYVVDGDTFIEVVNFAKHQNPHVKERPSEIPAPSMGQVQERHYPDRMPTPDKHYVDMPLAHQEAAATSEQEPKPDPDPSREPSRQDRRFEEFWQHYPRKIGKKSARRAWDKAKVSRELHGRILTAIERDKRSEQWQRDGGQYIPYPATWLNQGRWDDEPEEATNDATIRRDIAADQHGTTPASKQTGLAATGFHLATHRDD